MADMSHSHGSCHHVALRGDLLTLTFVSQGWHYLEVHQGHAMGKPGILEIGAVGRSKRQRDLGMSTPNAARNSANIASVSSGSSPAAAKSRA